MANQFSPINTLIDEYYACTHKWLKRGSSVFYLTLKVVYGPGETVIHPSLNSHYKLYNTEHPLYDYAVVDGFDLEASL